MDGEAKQFFRQHFYMYILDLNDVIDFIKMIIIKRLILFLLFFFYNNYVNGLIINSAGFFRVESAQIFKPIITEFNEYAEKNNLNITVKLNLFSNINSVLSLEDYGSMLESLLEKKSEKYDILFYNNMFIPRIGKYLSDLNDFLPKEHLEMYDSKMKSDFCSYKDKLVGLPITRFYNVLYYNSVLINKYNQYVPKTWDDIIKVGKHILTEEKKINNTELIGYNGLFDDTDFGSSSILQFLHSFRKEVNSTFPEINSPEVTEALKMMKKVKNEISSDETFSKDISYTISKILDGNAIFINYWIYPHLSASYKFTQPPGAINGVSSSVAQTFNAGVNNHISNEKKIASYKFIEFATSREIQKEFVIKKMIVSSIKDMYQDEEICKDYNCNALMNMQLIGRPINENYKTYSEKFRKYVYEYLYGNKSISQVIKNLENITKIHYISIKPIDDYIGLICFIIITILSFLMLFSLAFIFIENFNPFFKFLSQDLWIINILGHIFILCSCFIKYGEESRLKCYFSLILSIGFTICYAPIFYKLVVYFPKINSISDWVSRHNYLFISLLYLIDIIILIFAILQPFQITKNVDNNNIIYQTCEITKFHGLINFLMIGYKIILSSIISLLMFIEWSIDEIRYDLRFIVSGLYVIFMSMIISFILKIIIINNYTPNYLIPLCLIIIAAFSNYFFTYGYRIILGILNKQNVKLAFICQINQGFINNESVIPESISQFKSTKY
ncbi:periplasmic binding protein-like II [Anaeromyces robustus]|uniref:Periplasmic binding protein-like II n=1 Tax=Anaeromyces robustus TaxID=1754192 RepID=A0A1Y1X0F3_9FUNG|nr:periplasmic binding protein-like II [Anaeromyces robustus]|eukprot:ORX79299.1 periplasmic binding protein-like II [Anaeromyces robustus]